MTMNITVATPRFVIVASDRRLTDIVDKKIVTERSTKLTQLCCADALALISYNGVGLFNGKTPSDWLQELDSKVGLSTLPFKDVLQEIRKESDRRIASLPVTWKDRRHSFVIGAWGQGRTWICVISNYESAVSDVTEDKAQNCFSISEFPEEPGRETRVLATGSTQHLNREDFKRIGQAAKKSGAAGVDIKNLCVKVIQNTSLQKRKTGGVGTSVLWAIAERGKTVEGGLDVLGGTSVYEMPNLIVSGKQYKDIRIEPARGESISWGKPFPLPELKCKKCKSPVPLGYKECGVCGDKIE